MTPLSNVTQLVNDVRAIAKQLDGPSGWGIAAVKVRGAADALERQAEELKRLDPDPVYCGCHEAGCPHTPVAQLPRAELVKYWKERVKLVEADRDRALERQQRELEEMGAERNALFKAAKLVGQDDWAFFTCEGLLVINCGDTFAYACADAEELPIDKIDEVLALEREYGFDGVVAWIATHRNCEPIKERATERYLVARTTLATRKVDKERG